MHLLFVDDDLLLARAVTMALQQADFTVTHIPSPDEALRWLRTQRPDAMIFDVDLQSTRTGYDLCRLVRTGGWTGEYALRADDFAHVPILMLTGHDARDEQLIGFDAGASDYMGKQNLYISKRDLDMRLLVARLRALTGRATTRSETPTLIRVKALTIYPQEERVVAEDRDLDLTQTEYKLLHWLAKHPGQVQSRSTLLQEVWGFAADDNTRAVDVCVRRLREKLSSHGLAELIESKHGVGYFLVN